jgi:hypothetical protein
MMLSRIVCVSCGSDELILSSVKAIDGSGFTVEAKCRSCKWSSGLYKTEEELLTRLTTLGDPVPVSSKIISQLRAAKAEMTEGELQAIRGICDQQLIRLRAQSHRLATYSIPLPRATFAMDEGIPIQGYELPGAWNGWAKPTFTADAICSWLAQNDITFTYFPARATIEVRSEDVEPETWAGIITNTVDGELLLYAVGAGSWTWDKEYSDWR